MDKKPKKPRFYTFMIVPHDALGRPISLKLPVSWLKTALFLAIFSILLVGSSIVYSTLISRKLLNYADTLYRSRQQQVVIKSFSDKTSQVSQAINELVQKDNELRKLLGLKSWESKVKLSTDQISPEAKTSKVSLEFDLANAKLAERRQSLEELQQWVAVVRSRFAATPSTWPIYGRLASFFGYRVYPWRGVHTGIDITANYGAPARATAAGVVSFVGWRKGYGKIVEINHGYGVSTLYAHNSGYAVRVGQRVGRGQIVSYVGMTGWTTGPHLHYEVRRGDRPVNPIAYLDLNILSASRLWTMNH
jgi:murein DD-endopeptidase MepM/ murein hydrolase activator NlpD